jgi:hypothetical protein
VRPNEETVTNPSTQNEAADLLWKKLRARMRTLDKIIYEGESYRGFQFDDAAWYYINNKGKVFWSVEGDLDPIDNDSAGSATVSLDDEKRAADLVWKAIRSSISAYGEKNVNGEDGWTFSLAYNSYFVNRAGKIYLGKLDGSYVPLDNDADSGETITAIPDNSRAEWNRCADILRKEGLLSFPRAAFIESGEETINGEICKVFRVGNDTEERFITSSWYAVNKVGKIYEMDGATGAYVPVALPGDAKDPFICRGTVTVKIKDGVLNMRGGPGKSYPIVKKLENGEMLYASRWSWDISNNASESKWFNPSLTVK